MKLTVFLVVVSLFQIQAKTYSQNPNVTLNFNQIEIGELFEEIQAVSDMNFLYNVNDIDLERRVSVNVSKKPLSKVLSEVFKNTGLSFEIQGDQVIVFPSPPIVVKTEIQEVITGMVTNEEGMPLIGVTVLIKGTNNGTITNFDGEYSIEVNNPDSTLVFSYIGYETKEILLDGRENIDVIMTEKLGELDEVVLVGYGKNEKRDIIGSVGVVEMENIQSQAPTINVDAALQGQVPGVFVSSASGQPGAAAKIRIRGTTSLWGSNQPLYVIDGIPVVPGSNIPVGGTEGGRLGTALAQRGLSTPIGNISASDIASISILKDASAGAIYGSRAANGVIIIETKSGAFSGKPHFTVDFSISTQKPKTLEVLNAEQFKEVTTTAIANGNRDNDYTQSVLDGSYFGDADTNWEEVISPSNPVTTYFDLSARGGSDNTRYYTSIGATTQDGVFEGTGFDRYSFRLNLDTKISDIWTFGINSSLSYTNQNALDGGLTNRMYIFRPDVPIYDEEGNFTVSPEYNLENPVALSKATNNNKTLLLLTSFFTKVDLTDYFSVKSMIALNYNNGIQQSYYPEFTFTGGWRSYSGLGDGFAQESRSNFSNLMWENTLRYNRIFSDIHEVDAVVGASFEQTSNSYVKAWGEGFFNDVLTNISSATLNRDASSYKSESGLVSYFGRVNYDYNSKYLLTLSGRVDGSSKFAVENKYAFFPAAAIGWRISEENFLNEVEEINSIKLRTSWGITGQQDFGPYQWRTLFGTDDYGNEPSIIATQLGNDELKWERTRQFDAGIDFALFDQRITGGIGYYVKDTEDAIFPVITPGNTGFTTVLANVGTTRNSGFEFLINADILRKENFNWNFSFNASVNRNELVSISDDFKDEEGFITGFGGGGRLKEGSPIGLIYGYVAEGIFQTEEEIETLNEAAPGGIYQESGTAPGDLKFADISGPEGVPDGIVDSYDQTIIGDTQPALFGGFTNTLSYKGFSLRALFTYTIGNDLHWFNQARSINFSSTFLGENKTLAVLNAWTPENPTNQPRIAYGDPNNNDRISSYYVYDASYLRLKSLNLRYNFSQDFLDNLGFLNSASIYVIGQNLLTFTSYPGADPETTNLYNNDISAGRDNNRYPVSKVFTAGIKIGF